MSHGAASSTTREAKEHLQAVVLIHGIGEQKPMASLRIFVQSVLGGNDTRSYYSKPDRLSESFELRRLQAHKTDFRTRTDFYEFYWANQMQGTKLGQVLAWLRTLLIRKPSNLPSAFKPLYWWTWALIGIAAVLGAAGFRARVPELPGVLVGGLIAGSQYLIVHFMGDAARYLSPTPSNVGSRQAIRASGIELLRRLHESGEYDRVIIVGHSLGSVIGYDMIKHLWSDYHGIHLAPEIWPADVAQRALKDIEALGPKLGSNPNKGDLRGFRKAQRALWVEQRTIGNPWLITDFITIGSPLTHALLLFAKDAPDLEAQKRDGELPTCPPAPYGARHEIYSYKEESYAVDGQQRRVRVLSHDAPFAVVRWTNLYFPVKAWFGGDLVGGPLADTFGTGVLDVPLTRTKWQYWPLFPHVGYWRFGRFWKADESIGVLKSSLELNSSSWLPLKAPLPSKQETFPPIDRGHDAGVARE